MVEMVDQLKVNCKDCNAEVILTNSDALINWEKHGEICFRCRKKTKMGQNNNNHRNDEKELLLKEIKDCFFAFKNAWAVNHKSYEKLDKALERFFGKHHDFFADRMHDHFQEFFGMGENIPSWEDFKQFIVEFENKNSW